MEKNFSQEKMQERMNFLRQNKILKKVHFRERTGKNLYPDPHQYYNHKHRAKHASATEGLF